MEVPVLSVGEISNFIKTALETAFPVIKIFGEISNFSRHAGSGHLYFSLKDSEGVIKAICFQEFAREIILEPQSGMKVIVTGRLSAYAKTSSYQVIVTSIEEAGIGELHKLLLELKEKLLKEGLFDEAHKKKLPFPSKAIGLITSPGGAVLHDIIKTVEGKMPVKVIMFPSLMQGKGVVKNVISGIKYFNKEKNVDVIIIARGGGSFEDLFEFNNEELVRAAFKSKIPIISAIGHETDFTLLDFAASARAPTPTASVHLVLPSKIELLSSLEGKKNEIVAQVKHFFSLQENDLRNFTFTISIVKGVFEDRINCFSYLFSEILRASMEKLYFFETQLERLSSNIASYDYKEILSKGFAIVWNKEGKKITSPLQVKNGEQLEITLDEGKMEATVIKDTLF